ncbi:class I SAM-dependent DNA methyltransferase [Ornithinibacillus contaminans]|uniref:class I SAM-dependent DNA methyltransferase n=1 Tax=Ornithinibacillus contaminans TaxID=694055 RepID=UPI00064D9FE1|nr:class I SAM-dependent methyltransferase [Ornithinibacillus contaminans]
MAYHQVMAELYDKLMEDAPYDKWVTFTEAVLESYQVSGAKVADFGCGTGEITVRLSENGYEVTGVDYSADMLAIAEQKGTAANQTIRWIHQDLRELAGISQMDVVVSYCDVMNYITAKEDVQQVFKNVNKALSDNGLFIFDVHSLHHVEQDLVDHTFADVTDDSSYIWFCYPGESEGEMYHDLTFYHLQKDHYVRFDESHHQRTYSVATYRQLLENSGFEILKICGDFSVEMAFSEENAERIFFIAQKKDEIK